MSHRAIAAALALPEMSLGERLTAFALASFANREDRAWPGSRNAATRAGLSRGQYLAARQSLTARGLLTIEAAGGGRSNAALVALTFAQDGPWFEAEVNAELFELVLAYSRLRGSARLLFASLAALSNSVGVTAGFSTHKLRLSAGLSDRTYRRARQQLLADGDAHLEDAGGGRGRTSCWRISDLRIIEGQPLKSKASRPTPRGSARPLLAQIDSGTGEKRRGAGGSGNPGQNRTL